VPRYLIWISWYTISMFKIEALHYFNKELFSLITTNLLNYNINCIYNIIIIYLLNILYAVLQIQIIKLSAHNLQHNIVLKFYFNFMKFKYWQMILKLNRYCLWYYFLHIIGIGTLKISTKQYNYTLYLTRPEDRKTTSYQALLRTVWWRPVHYWRKNLKKLPKIQ